MPIEKPPIRREEGYTYIEATVTLDRGIAAFDTMHFVEQCQKYPLAISVKRKDGQHPENFPEHRDGKSLMDLLLLGATKGTELEIKIKGTDKEAEKIALRLYSGLTSEYSRGMDFNRFGF